ncbi:FG-GAP repeat domain-containing protein [Streptomyces rubrogriseus]|uniref:FG-GAP repeat domain-containing protein n=1 Tax=Streptomyces rubrogriseus TaxID=194673 RepID=UPI000D5A0A81|nr:VCBS repeat-containing protein [Streptomyces rubrogriseus]
MKWAHRTKRRMLRAGPAAVALAAMTLTQVELAPHAVVTATTAPTAEKTGTSPQKAPASLDTQSRQALAEAEETGEPVEILGQRSETTRVFANPSGTFTEELYALPQWVRKGNRLVDIDPTLQATADGYETKATEVGVTFSGGGTGPMATVVREGRTLAFSWPGTLPSPEIAGETATYPEVLPGVDLKLHATTTGFGQALVVKNAEAAANPELRQITYGVTSDGVQLEEDAHDNLRALNPAGQEVFTGPAPRMWDSTTDNTAPTAAKQSLAASADEQTDDAFAPPPGSQQAPVPLDTDGETLSLSPDQDLLTGDNTQYPVYIDPSVSGSRYSWTIVNKKYPNSSFYNGAGWINSDGSKGTTTARAGYENETGGTTRSYFRMNTKKLWDTNKVITKSTFRIKNTWSWSCTKRNVDLWRSDAISSSTTWNSRPTRRQKLSTVDDAKGWGSSCPAGNLAFDTTAGAKDAAAGKWNTLQLELAAANESDVYGWKKFDARTAVMSTTYNTVPNVPTALDTSPSAGGCDTSAPFTVIGNTDVYLTARVYDSDGGTVKAQFRLWGYSDRSGGAEIYDQTVSATSGTVARARVPKATLAAKEAAAGGAFAWKVRAYDGSAYSAWTPTTTCGFGFDSTRPSHPPTVTSAQFPDGSDGWPAETGSVRSAGTFTLASGGISDVTKYQYWTDWDPTVRTATPSAAGGAKDVTMTPTSAGSHVLYARSIDKAGNASDLTTYLFYVNSPQIADQPGDLNGDGNSDMYGIRTDGSLRMYTGTGNGDVGVYAAASALNFDGASITHRGDWTDDGYEDLVSLNGSAGSKTLQLYPNNGYGFACSTTGEADPAGSGTCSVGHQELTVYDPANKHWESADQVIAIGDVDGPLDVDNDGTADVPGYPDLLVKDGDHLWLYYGAYSYRLDETAEPVLVGNGSWSGYDLIAPGDVNQNGHVDILARNRATGLLYLYPGTGPAGEGLGDISNRAQIGTNWSPANRPLITSPADADNNGTPDLWATSPDTDSGLYFYPTITTTGHGTPITVGSTGWLTFQALS